MGGLVRTAGLLSWIRSLSLRCQLPRLTPAFYLAYFLFFMVHDSLEVTMPLFFADGPVNIVYLGFLLTASKWARASLVMPVSRLSRCRQRSLLRMVLVATAVAFAAGLATGSVLSWMLAFFLLFTSTSVFNVILNPWLAAQTDDAQLGINLGVRDVFLYLGGFVGVLGTGWLMTRSGDDYRQVFAAYIGALLVLVWVIGRLRPEPVRSPPGRAPITPSRSASPLRAGHRGFLRYLGVTTLVTLGSVSLAYAVLMGRHLGIETEGVYLLFSSQVLVSAILSLTGGLLIDGCDKRTLLVVKVGLSGVSLTCVALQQPLFYYLGIWLWALQAALANVDAAYLFSTFAMEDTDRYWGVVSMANLVAASLGMMIYGALWAAGVTSLFYLALCPVLLGLVLSWHLPGTLRPRGSAGHEAS